MTDGAIDLGTPSQAAFFTTPNINNAVSIEKIIYKKEEEQGFCGTRISQKAAEASPSKKEISTKDLLDAVNIIH